MEATFVIVGGGIAGVSCAETLAFYQPEQSIILISESSLIKAVTDLLAITQNLTQFNVAEQRLNSLSERHTNITVIHDKLQTVLDKETVLITETGRRITYTYLCLCLGAKPKLIPQAENNPYILGIRDTDSVEAFLQKLKTSRKIAIVGNGGIASELIYKINKVEVDWIIKDKHITATFVDPGAAEFLKHRLAKTGDLTETAPNKRMRYEFDGSKKKSGAALGPDWYKNFDIEGSMSDYLPDIVKIHYEKEITKLEVVEDEHPLRVTLSTGETLKCDFLVSATGVEARKDFVTTTPLGVNDERSIKVNEFMQTSVPNIYAAGDVCFPDWEHAKHWFPMKLWTQARQMGCYAARSMSGAFNKEEILQDFCFEIFTHTTTLFGYKVILLGLYNGQKLDNQYEIIFRMTEKVEYIKLVMKDGRLQGAVLIGETDLEEMCENLILNQLDLSEYKEDLLNPNIDIEDYFD